MSMNDVERKKELKKKSTRYRSHVRVHVAMCMRRETWKQYSKESDGQSTHVHNACVRMFDILSSN